MTWDFAELNVLLDGTGSYAGAVQWTTESLDGIYCNTVAKGHVTQANACIEMKNVDRPIFSSDPPYYDNVPYADLSDFFYVWLRKSLHEILPDLFTTVLTPKIEELVADQVRYGGKAEARKHFEEGMGNVFRQMAEKNHPDYPVCLYYAFKQQEEDGDDEDPKAQNAVASSGWETFLGGLVEQGFQVGATWPMRTELSNRMRGLESNALASSIVLVCRPRPITAKSTTRRELLNSLRSELPEAMRLLQKSHIAPVDLAQAAIGPGMAVFSRYAKVLEADGSTMSVRTALQLINKALDEFLTEQEGDFDADSRWAVTWFDQHGFEEGPYGVAETLSKARNTSVEGLVEAGIIWSKAGKVRLLKREELPSDWNPEHDTRLTVWESVQHLIRVLEGEGEAAAGHLLLKLGPMGDVVRELAYRLYALCERKKWSQEAQAYNGLIVSWGAVSTQASNAPRPATGKQGRLDLED
jgi:putative DNA methylase